MVMLDPPYEPRDGESLSAYRTWLVRLVRAAASISDHVLLWGMAATLGPLVERGPRTHPDPKWIVWAITNGVTRSKSWRPGHQVCLHFVRKGVRLHAENFYSDAQAELAEEGRLMFQPMPSTVLSAPLVSPSQRRHEHEKPAEILRTLVRLCTKGGDVVVDPMCGSGALGDVAAELSRKSVLSDLDPALVGSVVSRLYGEGRRRYPSVNRIHPARERAELEARRQRGRELFEEMGSYGKVARTLGVSRQAVFAWVHETERRLERSGRRRGRPGVLSEDQVARLREILRAEPLRWTGALLVERIRSEFGIEILPDTARHLLLRLRRNNSD